MSKRISPGRAANSAEALGRATLEAYVGIVIAISQVVFPMTFIWKFLLICALAYIIADILWRNEKSVRLDKLSRTAVALFGVILVFALSFNQLRTAFISEYLFEAEPNTMYFTEFGPIGQIIATPNDINKYHVYGWPGSFMRVRSSLLLNLENKYQLMGLILHHNGDYDLKDERIQGLSGKYDIVNSDLAMKIVWGDEYVQQQLLGINPTFYVLLAVPKYLTTISTKSIREMLDQGCILVQVQAI